ncbi:hypothetical protein cyc_00919 [Cyclospora cayetanensis]|uniref:Uncharacterized protein n=1 Tax=Cyclospora cayetanensis TaxID=88456 RepID=A0A1D3D4Z9_9EIME|nr:hypothetical protein cyc_00919 [Cyclospora cayetanensis]
MYEERALECLPHLEEQRRGNGGRACPLLQQLSIVLLVCIFLFNTGGLVLEAGWHLLSIFSFCSQVSLAVASLALIALEAPSLSESGGTGGLREGLNGMPFSGNEENNPFGIPQGEIQEGDDPIHTPRSASLLERGVLACVLVGLFEVSLHFIGWGERDAVKALAGGATFAKARGWQYVRSSDFRSPEIISQEESIGAGDAALLPQPQLLLPQLPGAASESASAPIRYPESPQQPLHEPLLQFGSKALERAIAH